MCWCSGTLGVYELKETHTSENISAKFEDILLKWEITKDQIIAIVTDSGTINFNLFYLFIFNFYNLCCV